MGDPNDFNEDDDIDFDNSENEAVEDPADEPDTDEDESEETTAESEASAEDEPDENPAGVPRVKKARTDKRNSRIDQLIAEKKAAEKVAFDAEMRLQEMERSRATTTEKREPPKKPDPADFNYGEVDPAYLDAVVEYRVAERAVAADAERAEADKKVRAETEQREIAEKYRTLVSVGAEKHADFEKVIDSVPWDSELAYMVLNSENAVDIAWELCNDLSAFRKLTAMTPIQRAMEIGRLDGKHSAPSAARKKTTKAPEPMGTRKSKPAASTDEEIGSDLDELDKFMGY